MKSSNISILGSTGSIGRNTLKVVEHLGGINVKALAAGSNADELYSQVKKFRPELVSCIDDASASKLEALFSSNGASSTDLPRILVGDEGLNEVATFEGVDTVVSATVGAVGFVPTLKAIEKGRRIALANKETLVIAGELMTRAAAENSAELLPVDSEHNALHQCLRGESPKEVRRLILTASGGPFRTKSLEEIRNATVEEALDHPTWDMGDKISIDSATLMNKGLEVIEAHWLFGFDGDRIGVVVHPQSVVHSMVEYVDGSIIAQLGVTDMRHAIQYALTYPERLVNCLPPLDFTEVSKLTFEEPDLERFPNLKLAFDALERGGTVPAVLNASNEVAVQAFLDGKIPLHSIAAINKLLIENHIPEQIESLETVLAADAEARAIAADQVRAVLKAAAPSNSV
ncbi:MAG: 1-deoxy-D-xylulose-5-phosphate reductoisomerase [Pyrinomonadaceae bacterium]|nr:1-deoxy-D-xylulose-5-phosphate reductoisomerase [Pyrinomonadaceae bacterium]